MQYSERLPLEVQGKPLDVIAPEGGFEAIIRILQAQPKEFMLLVHDSDGNEIVLIVPELTSEHLVPGRGQEMFIENCTVTILNGIGDSSGIRADAWISLNPEVRTAGVAGGKIILWNPRQDERNS